jgi:hypothetical protein
VPKRADARGQSMRTARMQRYFILNGVRRALACRDAGLKTVPAIIHREGREPELRPRMRIASLVTSKQTVLRDLRFLSIVPPIHEPIEVEPLGARAQSSGVPLATVRLG